MAVLLCAAAVYPAWGADIRATGIELVPGEFAGGNSIPLGGALLGTGPTSLQLQPLSPSLKSPPVLSQTILAQLTQLQAQPIPTLKELKVSAEPDAVALYQVLAHPDMIAERKTALTSLLGPEGFKALAATAEQLRQLAGQDGTVRALLSSGDPAAALEEFKKRFDNAAFPPAAEDLPPAGPASELTAAQSDWLHTKLVRGSRPSMYEPSFRALVLNDAAAQKEMLHDLKETRNSLPDILSAIYGALEAVVASKGLGGSERTALAQALNDRFAATLESLSRNEAVSRSQRAVLAEVHDRFLHNYSVLSVLTRYRQAADRFGKLRKSAAALVAPSERQNYAANRWIIEPPVPAEQRGLWADREVPDIRETAETEIKINSRQFSLERLITRRRLVMKNPRFSKSLRASVNGALNSALDWFLQNEQDMCDMLKRLSEVSLRKTFANPRVLTERAHRMISVPNNANLRLVPEPGGYRVEAAFETDIQDDEALKTVKASIEEYWRGRFEYNGREYGFRTEVSIKKLAPGRRFSAGSLRLKDGHDDISDASLDTITLGRRLRYDTPAHEFGHIMGLEDDYREGANPELTAVVNLRNPASLMGSSFGKVLPRHFKTVYQLLRRHSMSPEQPEKLRNSAGQHEQGERPAQELEQAASRLAEDAGEAKTQAQNLKKTASQIRGQTGAMDIKSEDADDMDGQAAQLRRQASQLKQGAQELHKMAQRLRTRTSSGAVEKTLQKAQALEQMGKDLQEKSQELKERTQAFQKQLGKSGGQEPSSLRQKAAGIEDEAKDISKTAEKIQEQAHEAQSLAQAPSRKSGDSSPSGKASPIRGQKGARGNKPEDGDDMEGQAAQLRRQASQLKQASQELRKMAQPLKNKPSSDAAEKTLQKARTLEQMGKELQESAQELRERTQALRKRLGKSGGQKPGSLRQKAAGIEAEAKDISEKAEKIQRQAHEAQSPAQASSRKSGGSSASSEKSRSSQEPPSSPDPLEELLQTWSQQKPGANPSKSRDRADAKGRQSRPSAAESSVGDETSVAEGDIRENIEQIKSGGLNAEQRNDLESFLEPERGLIDSLAYKIRKRLQSSSLGRDLSGLFEGDIDEEALALYRTKSGIMKETLLPGQPKSRITFLLDLSGSMGKVGDSRNSLDHAARALLLALKAFHQAFRNQRGVEIRIFGYNGNPQIPILPEYTQAKDLTDAVIYQVLEQIKSLAGGGNCGTEMMEKSIDSIHDDMKSHPDTSYALLHIGDGDPGAHIASQISAIYADPSNAHIRFANLAAGPGAEKMHVDYRPHSFWAQDIAGLGTAWAEIVEAVFKKAWRTAP